MTARDDVLARIEAALAGSPPAGAIPRNYRVGGAGDAGSRDVVDLFVDRLLDYKARVHHTPPADIAATLRAVLQLATSVVAPPGLPSDWLDACAADGRSVLVDGTPVTLTAADLDASSAVVTACRVAIAETGTIVLDGGPDQGRRALSLVPDHHVVVVKADQIVASVPESLPYLNPSAPLTFISGPSATSDIEFQRVEGVHGPRVLDVVVVQTDAVAPPAPARRKARARSTGEVTQATRGRLE
jgi:L-lactate dehydrogenase complex protein LldG